ncbi:MAG: AAA family ATPase [Verrucomicrobia bacterium]|nr:AAA family ATPase [Cytophagales bacterium]
MKELIIIGGANGSGKTTFAKELIKETGYYFLNADEIESKLEAPKSPVTQVKAGRLFF